MTFGCWDHRELEDQAFILALGVDRGQGGYYDVSARIAIPRNIAPGGGGGPGGGGDGGGKASDLITVRAPTLEGALNLLGPLVGRRISIAHMVTVVIGEDVAREGVNPVLLGLLRFREARRTVLLNVALGTAREAMQKEEPPLDKDPARYVFKITETTRFNALVWESLLHTFSIATEALDRDPIALVKGINPKVSGRSADSGGQDQGPPTGGGSGDEGSFRAGEMPRKGGNPVEALGVAVFRNDQMVGVLTGDETRILLAIRGEFGRSIFSIPDPEVKGQFVAVELRRGRRPQFRVSIQDGMTSIREDIYLEGDLLAVPSGIDYTKPEKMVELERQIEAHLGDQARALVEKAQREFRADSFGFGQSVKRKFRTRKDWREFRWLSKFPEADVSVSFKVKLRRVGLQLAPTTPAPR